MRYVFLVGATKAGTSSLHAWLSHHPQIYLPRDKELHYLCSCPSRLRRCKSESDYWATLTPGDSASVLVAGEASPCYLYYSDVPGKLHDRFPHAKIVISLRDPVERFWSHWLMNNYYHANYPNAETIIKKFGIENGSISNSDELNAVHDLVGVGMYAAQVERYFSSFGTSNVFVAFLEETSLDPVGASERIQEFLEVEYASLPIHLREKVFGEPRNRLMKRLVRAWWLRRTLGRWIPPDLRRFMKHHLVADAQRKPPVPDSLRTQLRTLYTPDCIRLETSLGRSLPWSWHQASERSGSQHDPLPRPAVM